MSDLAGADTGPDLSLAYRALARRRDDVIAERDRMTGELEKLDAALEALRALADIVPQPATANGQEAASPASEVAQATAARTRKAASPARTAKIADRKVRIIEFLLEHPRSWFTSAEVADRTEEGSLSPAQRNAVSETLRRLLRRGCVDRDETTKPVKYRAIPAALRELLLTEE